MTGVVFHLRTLASPGEWITREGTAGMETCGTTVTVVGLEVGQWWCRGQTDRDGGGDGGGVWELG